MELKLNRPLCFFDLETTGIDIARDRIVEISVCKLSPDSSRQVRTWLVNPGRPIPKAVSDIHGITDEKVKDAPRFEQIAPVVYEMIRDSDLAGYNSNRFDIPMLAEELLRAGIDFDMGNRVAVDVQAIFYKKEPRTLSAAYKFYCGAELEGAHGAQADTLATYEVLKSQLDRYPDLPNDVRALSEYSTQRRTADFAGFIGYDADGDEIFTFGKYKGCKVAPVLENDPGYTGWILEKDFPLYTKRVITALRLRSKFSKEGKSKEGK